MIVAQDSPMILTSIMPESGPFQNRRARWHGTETKIGSIERMVATGFYLALMTAEYLALTGHDGPIIIEGPFAGNPSFCLMLATATNCIVEASGGTTGTSEGAALLALAAGSRPPSGGQRRMYQPKHEAFSKYAMSWKSAVSTDGAS